MPPRMQSPPEQDDVDFRELAQEVRARLQDMDRKLDMLSEKAGVLAEDAVNDPKLLPHIPEALQIQHTWTPKTLGGTPEPESHNGDPEGCIHLPKALEIQSTWAPRHLAGEEAWEEQNGNGGLKHERDVKTEDIDFHLASDAAKDASLHTASLASSDQDETAPVPATSSNEHRRNVDENRRITMVTDRVSKISSAAVERNSIKLDAKRNSKLSRSFSNPLSGISGASSRGTMDDNEKKATLSRQGTGTVSRVTSRRYNSEVQLTQPRKRPPLLARIYMFLEDAESSRMAHWYAVLMPMFTVCTVWVTLLQTHRPPVLNGMVAAALETVFDLVFTVEFLLRFMSCPSFRAFFRCGYNLIDLACVAPLFLRAAIGFRISSDKETVASSILLCIVPLVRLLKTLRRFQEIQLLWAAFQNALEALPVLMYTALTMNLAFSAIVFFLEPRWNIPTFGHAMWFTIVTMMTVGYGDTTPQSDAGMVVVAVLIVCSVLYMAMPLGIVGQMFSEVWEQRDRILLMKRTSAALLQWGYQAHDIPMLFDLFDTDGDGYLTLQEFQQMIEFLDIGMSRSRVGRLFDTFDVDGGGTVSDAEFVRGLFPNEYHDLFAAVGAVGAGSLGGGPNLTTESLLDHQADLHALVMQRKEQVVAQASFDPAVVEPPEGLPSRRQSIVVIRGRRASTLVSRKYEAPIPNLNVRSHAEFFAAKGKELSLTASMLLSDEDDNKFYTEDEDGFSPLEEEGSERRRSDRGSVASALERHSGGERSSHRHVSFSREPGQHPVFPVGVPTRTPLKEGEEDAGQTMIFPLEAVTPLKEDDEDLYIM